MTQLEALVEEARDVQAFLPNIRQLEDAIHKTSEWTKRVEEILSDEHYPYLDVIETLVNKGRPISARLERLPALESQVGYFKCD